MAEISTTGPKTAVYTVRTYGNGMFREWPSKETAFAFLNYSVYEAQNQFNHVVLHTDPYGKYILRDIKFDEVIVSLDQFDIDPAIKCAAKLDTYSKQTKPFVHMDWDFILWKKMGNRLKFPVVAQSRSWDNRYSRLSLIWRSLPWKPAFVDEILENYSCVELPCPSFLGGTEVDFLTWYSKLALEILRHPKNGFIQKMAQGEASPDISIALEQWLLGACAAHRGVKLNYLSETASPHLNSNEPENAEALGFTHLSGDRKHSPFWIGKIQQLITDTGLSNTSEALTTEKTDPLGGETIDLKTIPYKAFVSVEKQRQRRDNAMRTFADLGLKVAWKNPPKPETIRWNPTNQCFWGKPEKASHAAIMLEIFNEAQAQGAESLLIFEDDVVFHPELEILLPLIKVPSDWKFIYIGGRNCGIKRKISRGLFRSNFIVDLHALIIKMDIIDEVKQVLMDPCINSMFLDFRLASLHNQYPAYLCRPNLAWQSAHSDDSGKGMAYSNYHPDGTVRHGQGD